MLTYNVFGPTILDYVPGDLVLAFLRLEKRPHFNYACLEARFLFVSMNEKVRRARGVRAELSRSQASQDTKEIGINNNIPISKTTAP